MIKSVYNYSAAHRFDTKLGVIYTVSMYQCGYTLGNGELELLLDQQKTQFHHLNWKDMRRANH